MGWGRKEPAMLGKGRTAEVYDAGKDRVLKLFKPSIPFETVQSEMIKTHAACMSGLPVADSYGIVRSGERYGFLMKKMQGITLEEMIRNNPEERENLLLRFAGSVKAMHQVRITDPALPDMKDLSVDYTWKLSREYCSKDDERRIRSVFEHIPRADTFVHGDCHTGNAIVAGNKIHFFDLMFSGKGHPVFDLLAMYSHYIFLPSFGTKEEYLAKNNMTVTDAVDIFERFLDSYYPGADEDRLSRIRSVIRGIHAAQLTLASVRAPGAFTGEMLMEVKQRALDFSEQYDLGKMEEDLSEWSLITSV